MREPPSRSPPRRGFGTTNERSGGRAGAHSSSLKGNSSGTASTSTTRISYASSPRSMSLTKFTSTLIPICSSAPLMTPQRMLLYRSSDSDAGSSTYSTKGISSRTWRRTDVGDRQSARGATARRGPPTARARGGGNASRCARRTRLHSLALPEASVDQLLHVAVTPRNILKPAWVHTSRARGGAVSGRACAAVRNATQVRRGAFSVRARAGAPSRRSPSPRGSSRTARRSWRGTRR